MSAVVRFTISSLPDCDMPFAANDFLARIEAALFRRGRLD
ncbi:hypothetical protein BDIM_16240 [Brevundimonas diminuta ATCC 11568]|nr:hypothetical protein BDIM_16240 [Brevundimonas diminuta ATCC 11568]